MEMLYCYRSWPFELAYSHGVWQKIGNLQRDFMHTNAEKSRTFEVDENGFKLNRRMSPVLLLIRLFNFFKTRFVLSNVMKIIKLQKLRFTRELSVTAFARKRKTTVVYLRQNRSAEIDKKRGWGMRSNTVCRDAEREQRVRESHSVAVRFAVVRHAAVVGAGGASRGAGDGRPGACRGTGPAAGRHRTGIVRAVRGTGPGRRHVRRTGGDRDPGEGHHDGDRAKRP